MLANEARGGASEDDAKGQVLSKDKTCQNYILLAMQQYTAALRINTKHVYRALPRMLSLWFDLVSVSSDGNLGSSGKPRPFNLPC